MIHKNRLLFVALAILIIVGVMGAWLSFITHATTSAALEAEVGTKVGVTTVADSSASSGGAVRFAAPLKGTVKLMPLGDSITWGVGSPTGSGGYRVKLWQDLVQTDHDNIDFVGSRSGGPDTLGDKDNEGHPSWCLAGTCGTYDTLQNNIVSWLTTYQPDIILLHIGTNDINGYGATGATMATRLDTFLSTVYATTPKVHVVVAQLIPLLYPGFPTRQQAISDYNAAMPGIAAKYQSEGHDVRVVNMFNILDTSTDYYDTVHPNQQGYDKMADAWYPVVKNIYDGL